MSIMAISRQVGSQGEKIAESVSQKMGLELVTRDRIHELTYQCDPKLGKACSMYEKEVPKSFWARHFFKTAKQTALFEWLTFKLASQGNVILIGRGAPIVLHQLPEVLKVRIVAPFTLRVLQVQEELGMGYVEAEHFVSSYGRLRRNLIESIFKVNLSDPNLYDLQLNTAELTTEDATAILETAINAKIKSVDQEQLLKDLVWATQMKKVKLDIYNELNPGIWQQITTRSGEKSEVVISGFVREDRLRSRAEELAFRVEGVEKVDNRIEVIDPSSDD